MSIEIFKISVADKRTEYIKTSMSEIPVETNLKPYKYLEKVFVKKISEYKENNISVYFLECVGNKPFNKIEIIEGPTQFCDKTKIVTCFKKDELKGFVFSLKLDECIGLIPAVYKTTSSKPKNTQQKLIETLKSENTLLKEEIFHLKEQLNNLKEEVF